MSKVKNGQIYKHFKGNYYIVLDVGIDTESNEDVVIYKALYGKKQIYVRPLKMFLEDVDKAKYPNIKEKKRFTLVKLGE